MRRNEQKQKNIAPQSRAKKRRVTHEHHYTAYMLAGLLSFPVVAFIISPFFHELFHIFVLQSYSCPYWADFQFSLGNGLYATLYPKCAMSNIQLAVLYLAGIAGTLAIGSLLLVLDWQLTKNGCLEYSIFTSFMAMGFLFSPVIYFFSEEGDLANSLNVMSINYPSYLFPLIGAAIMSFSLIYFWLNLNYTSDQELLEEQKEELDRFGVRKTKKSEHKKYMPK